MEQNNILENLRKNIDNIDSQILSLINERANIAKEIGNIKGESAIYHPDREAKVLNRIKNNNKGPLSNESILKIFREIMSECLAIEKPLTISYLGPEGTFTELAAVKHFGGASFLKPQPTIDNVFLEVELGHCDYAVVPIENSTEGSVGRTLDLLVTTPLTACGEVLLKINHNLISKEDDKSNIKKIYSHSQSLAQCYEWLNRNFDPSIKRIAVNSNAEAVKLASKENNTAAIASIQCAGIYGLNILEYNIEDIPNNTTRFLVLGKEKIKPSEHDKTSLIVSTKNEPGAMYNILKPLAENGVDMTKLESRPSKTILWEYNFFLDINGHIENDNIKKALKELEERVIFIKHIGSYPIAILK